MRAGLDDRELAVAVRERLRRAGQLLVVQAASPSGPSGLIWTGWPVALTLRALSQWSRTVLSDRRA